MMGKESCEVDMICCILVAVVRTCLHWFSCLPMLTNIMLCMSLHFSHCGTRGSY